MKKTKNCCKKVIKGCDCFGTFISFRINDDLEYKSLIGGCFTIIFVLFSLIYILYMAYGFLTRSTINFIFSNKIVDSSPLVNLTASQVTIAFGIQYPEDSADAITQFSDYLEYTVSLVEWIGEDEMLQENFTLKRCTSDDFFGLVDESFENNQLYDLLCPNLTDYSNFTLEGLYTDYYYKFLTLTVSLTDEAMTEGGQNKLKEMMNDTPIEMAIFFLDTAIDYENRKNPLPTYINYSTKSLDLDYYKSTTVFLSALEFKKDDNLLYDNAQLITDTMYDYSVDSFKYITDRLGDEENIIGDFTIKASPKVIQLNRSYQKFPSFLADLTSILEEILVLMLLIVNFFERKAVDHKLIEKMLKFRGSKYYDVDYLISVFDKDKISANIMSIIEKQKLKIERKNNVVSQRKSVMILLNNKVPPNGLQTSNIAGTDGDSERCLIQNKEENKLKNVKIQTVNNLKENNAKNILNQNIQSASDTLCSKKNSIYFVKEDLSENSIHKVEPLEIENNEIREEKYKNLNLCEIMCATFCFWTSRKQKERCNIITKAEKKIHYYLDIYTYIKKMQEIDLLKYCLFDEDQLELFDFLSKPPVKLNAGSLGIYQEFEKNQIHKKKLGKQEINCLFSCYNSICSKSELTFEDLKLLRLVKAEIDFLK